MGNLKPGDLDLDSGLADDFDGPVVNAWFAINPEYAAKSGTSDPMITLSIDSPDFDKNIEQGWSCGGAKKWEAIEGGKRVVSQVNPSHVVFNAKSRAGMLVSRMFQLIGEGNADKGKEFFYKRGYTMTEAAFFTGLNWHWAREPMEKVEGGSSDVLMPVVFLGETKVQAKGEYAPELVDKLCELSAGKNERELKQVANKELDKTADGYNAFMKVVLDGSLIKQLIEEGKLSVGPDSKFI